MAGSGGSGLRAPARKSLAAGVLAAVIFGLLWGLHQPARPVPATADLYTHLEVARHLARGEGYLTDLAYPLSFAYPFARALPQPLIHRMPGFGTVLTVPWLLSGRDPVRAVQAVRVMQILLVVIMAGIGAWALWRRGSGTGAPLWLILLGTSPLLDFGVAWGQDEILAGGMLLVIWLLTRDEEAPGPFLAGALTGLLALVRLELFWVPLLWWLLMARRRDPAFPRLRPDPVFWLMFAAATTVLVPWSLRTLNLTGQPFFTLQGVAEAAKDTRVFPGYSVYKGLDPQPLLSFILHHPDPLARKIMRGLRFYLEDMPRFLAWPWLLVAASAPLLAAWRRARGLAREGASARGLSVAVLTLVLLAVFYSPFDHSLRHLLPVLPVLAWELAAYAAGPRRAATGLETGVRMGFLAAVAMAAVVVFPCRLPGWEQAAAEAVRTSPLVQKEAARLRETGRAVLFTPYAAAPWLADRPAVWSPGDPAVRERIRDLMRAD